VFEHYVDLRNRYPNFRLLQGVAPDQLPQVLQYYDFGLLMTDFTAARTRISWGQRVGTFGTKIFAYLEAGIPVIVNAEYTAMAKLVEQNEVGIAVSSVEVVALREIIKSVNYPALLRNISKFQARNAMAIRIHELLDAIGDA